MSNEDYATYEGVEDQKKRIELCERWLQLQHIRVTATFRTDMVNAIATSLTILGIAVLLISSVVFTISYGKYLDSKKPVETKTEKLEVDK